MKSPGQTLTILGLRAVFTETHNAELNRVLQTIQEKIILPAYLPEKQRELVFDPKKRQQIQQNPIIIELDGLEHKFSTIDRFTEVPNSKRIMLKAIDLMKTKEDWNNLETLLAGYYKAGIKIQQRHWARISRTAALKGNPYAIIECAKQSQKTGLSLADRETLTQLLSGVNRQITFGTSTEQKKKEAAQAWKRMRLIADLLHRPEHTTQSQEFMDKLRNAPFTQGLFLFPQAVVVKTMKAAGEPIEAELKELSESVEKIVAIWSKYDISNISQIPDIQQLNWLSETNRAKPKDEWDGALSGNDYVRTVGQIIEGLSLSQELVGKPAKDLKPVQEALEQHLKEFVVAGYERGFGAFWAELFEEITGRKPDWPPSPPSKKGRKTA